MFKRIAIFARNPSGHGGIEAVVRQHLRIFSEHSCECLLFGQAGCENIIPIEGEARRIALRKLMMDFSPDVCILHGSTHPGMKDDSVVFRELRIPTVAVCHFSFPSVMLLTGEEDVNRCFAEASRMCDIVATVSKMDALWWRAHGLRAMHVQNPFVHPKNVDLSRRPGEDGTTNLIWVGRQAEQKQPSSALAAFARLHRARPKTHLIMVGGSAAGWRMLQREAVRLGCVEAVEFIPERADISDLWRRADIHLLTSITESFCLVLAEAKAYGIPTVMFEIPFLELVQGAQGILTAPQQDVLRLSDQVLKLVDDRNLYRRLAREAKSSQVGFNDNAVWDSWVKVFAAIECGVDEDEEIPKVYRQLIFQASMGWNYYVGKNRWLMQMEADLAKLSGGRVSFWVLAWILRRIVIFLQKIKSVFHA